MLRTITFLLLSWIYVALHKAAVLNDGRLGLRRGFLHSRLMHGPPRVDAVRPMIGATRCLSDCSLKPNSPIPQKPLPSPTKTTSFVTPRHTTKPTTTKLATEPIKTSFVTPRHTTKATTTKLNTGFHRVHVKVPFFGWGLPV